MSLKCPAEQAVSTELQEQPGHTTSTVRVPPHQMMMCEQLQVNSY